MMTFAEKCIHGWKWRRERGSRSQVGYFSTLSIKAEVHKTIQVHKDRHEISQQANTGRFSRTATSYQWLVLVTRRSQNKNTNPENELSVNVNTQGLSHNIDRAPLREDTEQTLECHQGRQCFPRTFLPFYFPMLELRL